MTVYLSSVELKLLKSLIFYDIELSDAMEPDYKDTQEMQQNYIRSILLRKIEHAITLKEYTNDQHTT